jgi:hypothetical protein
MSIISWKFWDGWLQKLFVQLISVKVMALVATVILCVYGFINGGNLAVVFGVIFGAKGAFQVANVIKNGNGAKKEEMIDKV